MSAQRTIVIIGAGFSGTLVAANLLKAQHWSDTRIVLIERSAQVARGAAYAQRGYPYLLNVPAGRMSANASLPLDFLNFAQARIPDATAEDFLPRELYGQYLEATLLEAEVSAATHVEFQRVRADVCGIEPIEPAGYRVELADGRQLEADDVVLALGNPSPADLPSATELGSHYTGNPWAGQLSFTPGETVLLVGTGLTMADVALAAAADTNDQITIHAMSRHGLIPPSQTQFSQNACKADSASILRAASFSALTLLRSVRELADDTERRGGDWRETITFIRNIAPQLWQRLPAREKRRLLRHIRPYWDIHRHRLPSQTLARMHYLRRHEKLNIHAGRLMQFELVPTEAAGSKVRVTWRARGTDEVRTMLVDRVINCTGPDYNIHRSRDPLMRSLVSQGLAVADPLNLGLRTGAYGALINAQGQAAPNLFYVGPMLRADHWETTAAQELRGYAERLAGYLSAPVGRLRAVASA
jgi:uncharacterized NAD(P)/FAD-binding protein YdhS